MSEHNVASASAAVTPLIDASLVPSRAAREDLREAVNAHTSAMKKHLKSFTASPDLRIVSGEGEAQALAGYVACLSGQRPVLGTEAEGIVTKHTGTGVSWFDVQDADSSTIARVVSGFRERTAGGGGNSGGNGDDDDGEGSGGSQRTAGGNAFSLTKTGAVVGLYTFRDEGEERHAIVVIANDRRAASRMQRRVSAVAAAGAPLTLDQVFDDETGMYNETVQRSRDMRMKVAAAWAHAHGLKLGNDGRPSGSYETHFLALAPSGAGADRTIAVYNDAIDPSTAHSGVLVWHGALSGFWHMAAAVHTTGEGDRSQAWSSSKQERPSLFPTSSGLWTGVAAGRPASMHAGQSEKLEAFARSRVAWDGRVRAYNPRAALVYNDFDMETSRWMHELKAAPGGPVKRTEWHTVVLAMPGIDTRRAALPDLVDVIDRSGEQHMLVHGTSPVVHALVDAWPRVRKAPAVQAAYGLDANVGDGAGPSLAHALSDEVPGESAFNIKAEVLRALHKATTKQQQQQQQQHKHAGEE